MIKRTEETILNIPVFPDISLHEYGNRIVLETHVRVKRKSDGVWFKVNVINDYINPTKDDLINFLHRFHTECFKCSTLFDLPDDKTLEHWRKNNPDNYIKDYDQRDEKDRLQAHG
jgi:hypothetical protein